MELLCKRKHFFFLKNRHFVKIVRCIVAIFVSGIQGAMKHDKIMDSGRPDYAIVEAEAEKVAREAAAALKRSRQLCSSALSGLPNWTGQSGGLAK